MSLTPLLAALFERTGLWPLLLIAPACWLLLRLLERRRARERARFLGPRAALVSPARAPGRTALARLAFALALLLGLAALLHPSLGATAPASAWRGMDVVVALDVSRSMLARDVAPDRLTRAKDEVRTLAAAAEGDRLGLVLFAGEARVRVPLTRDRASVATIAEIAEPTDVLRGGTDLAAALETAAGMVERGAEGHSAVVLLTDGEDHGARGQTLAGQLRSRGIAVHVVGLGTPRGSRITLPAAEGGAETYLQDRTGGEVLSRLDEAGLRALAEAGGGAYATLGAGTRTLADLHAAHLRPQARAQAVSDGRLLPENRYQLLLAAALALLLLDLALRARRRATRAAPSTQHTAARTSASVRLPRAAAVLGVLLLLGSCDATHEPSPEQQMNEALAELRVGALDKAAEASRRAERAGGARLGPVAAFVRGNVAFARSLEAEVEATRPGGDLAYLERALTLTEDALAAWRFAATSRADWPEARRNVERALLRLDSLREKRSTGADPRRRPVVLPPTPPTPPTPDHNAEATTDPNATVVSTDLAPAEVAALHETLRAKERQRQALRRAQRERAGGSVEKDW